jgi:hypothetical protein
MFREIDGEIYQLTARNGGFPALGYYRVFPKKSFTDERGFWELVAKRTRSFEFDIYPNGSIVVWGFENLDLDKLELTIDDFQGYTQLKSVLKQMGWPSCTALEMYCAYHKHLL